MYFFLEHVIRQSQSIFRPTNRIWWLHKSTLVEWYEQLVLTIDHKSLGASKCANELGADAPVIGRNSKQHHWASGDFVEGWILCCSFAVSWIVPYISSHLLYSLIQKPNLVARIWPPNLLTICAWLPKLVANVSSKFHHLVNTGLAFGSLARWLPIMVVHTCKLDTILTTYISPIGNNSIQL